MYFCIYIYALPRYCLGLSKTLNKRTSPGENSFLRTMDNVKVNKAVVLPPGCLKKALILLIVWD